LFSLDLLPPYVGERVCGWGVGNNYRAHDLRFATNMAAGDEAFLLTDFLYVLRR
jgi:hypothetical protein